MKKIVALALVCFLSMQAFAQDKGALEIETGLDVLMATWLYDQDGEFFEVPSGYSPMGIFIPVSILYEILPGLQAGMKARYIYFNEDWWDVSGLMQPAVEVKYTSDFGLGAFVDVYLPFGSEDVVGPEPEFYLDLAVFYDGTFDAFSLYGEVIYTLTFEGDDSIKQDSMIIRLTPGYQIMDTLTLTLTAEFDLVFDWILSGTTLPDKNSNLFALAPGVKYLPTEMLELSLEVPFTLFGKSDFAYWGISFRAKIFLL